MRADSARTGSVRTESAGTDSDTCLPVRARERTAHTPADRKSTRLNSSHDQISYAVFCLKKKNTRPLFRSQRKRTRLNSSPDQIEYATFCLHTQNLQPRSPHHRTNFYPHSLAHLHTGPVR